MPLRSATKTLVVCDQSHMEMEERLLGDALECLSGASFQGGDVNRHDILAFCPEAWPFLTVSEAAR